MGSGAAGAGAAGAGAAAGGGVAGDAGDAGQQGAAEAQNGHAQNGQGLDSGAIAEMLTQLTQAQESMRQQLLGRGEPDGGLDGGEGLEAGADDGLDLDTLLGDGELPWNGDAGGFDDDGAHELAEGFAAAQEKFMAPLIDAIADQQEQITEQQEALATERRAREYTALAQEFPEMGSPEVVEQTVQAARAVGEAVGFTPAQATSPLVLRMVFLSMKALEAQQAEEERGADADAAAHLEGAGGSVPTGGPPDAGERWKRNVAGMRRGSAVLPWGGSS